MHMYAAALLASAAALAPSTPPRQRSRRYTAVAEPETTETKVEPPKCPLNAEAQLLAARDATESVEGRRHAPAIKDIKKGRRARAARRDVDGRNYAALRRVPTAGARFAQEDWRGAR